MRDSNFRKLRRLAGPRPGSSEADHGCAIRFPAPCPGGGGSLRGGSLGAGSPSGPLRIDGSSAGGGAGSGPLGGSRRSPSRSGVPGSMAGAGDGSSRAGGTFGSGWLMCSLRANVVPRPVRSSTGRGTAHRRGKRSRPRGMATPRSSCPDDRQKCPGCMAEVPRCRHAVVVTRPCATPKAFASTTSSRS